MIVIIDLVVISDGVHITLILVRASITPMKKGNMSSNNSEKQQEIWPNNNNWNMLLSLLAFKYAYQHKLMRTISIHIKNYNNYLLLFLRGFKRHTTNIFEIPMKMWVNIVKEEYVDYTSLNLWSIFLRIIFPSPFSISVHRHFCLRWCGRYTHNMNG